AEAARAAEHRGGWERAGGHLGGPARDTRRQEESVGLPGAVGVQEHARDLLGAEVGPPYLAPAEGGAIAAGEGTGVGLHDPHEPGRPVAGVAHPRDAYGVAWAHQGALRAVRVG